ncbi:MAG TPA: squalene/phytoene synthase family protein [Oleiagrimonas sp.]|nr:squalene/phytoene synthase family protein [Oleiagrimonas sp.]
MTDPTLHTYIDKWLAARPARHQALPFMRDTRRDTMLATCALEHELVSATYGISEPEVAAAKLNWWGEELGGAAASGGRHPLVKALFADPAVRDIDPAVWLAPVVAALARQDQATPADFATQMERTQAFHRTLAALETRICFGADADPARASRMASLDYLLQALTVAPENATVGRLPLPMDRMARHNLDRDGLADDGSERRAAVAEQLADLAAQWRQAWQLPGPLSLFRGFDARLGQRWARRAMRANDPLARLRHEQKRQTGFASVRLAWLAARAARAG